MSYPNITTSAPSASELARRADNDARLQVRQRARQIQLKLVGAFERIVDQLTQEQERHALARADERRQFANMLHASEFCTHRRCRRTHSCQGEPADCLRVLLPAIGLDKAVAHLVARRQRPRRKRSGAA